MKIFYQWVIGSYSHLVANILNNSMDEDVDIEGKFSFKDIFEDIKNDNLWVIPIENGYAGSVIENFYNLSFYDVEIIGEYYKTINHHLLSVADSLDKVKYVYSHPQALMQCEWFLSRNNLEAISVSDTATAAEYVSSQNNSSLAAISSSYCRDIYNLSSLAESIQDQQGNTTRFFVIKKKNKEIALPQSYYEKFSSGSKGKISLLFRTKHQPASLYKCLGCFATRDINLTKIESLSARDNPFSYMFWIDCEWSLDDQFVKWALEELDFFTSKLSVLGSY